MDIESYSKKDLFLTALKSEMDSKNVYNSLAQSVKNFMLKDKLEFLAVEEQKHYDFFKILWEEAFPDEDIALPNENPVPLPEIEFDPEDIRFSDVFQQAMDAEKAAHYFYLSLANRFKMDEELSRRLKYIASMEMGHYRLLEIEKQQAEEFEMYDEEFEMMHVGP
ncbi:MAG: ferritin family protein [Candidatus Cloacimonetes bacterium]|nr:ferritin family protein [Candidatus Cloacimonadota bacterium]